MTHSGVARELREECFFVLRRLLADICASELPGNGSFIAVAPDGLQVRFYKTARVQRLQVCLFYNRRFKRPSRAMTLQRLL
jgi:hypothetical protein